MRKGYSLFGSIPKLIGEDPALDMLSSRDEYWMAQTLLEGMQSCGLSEPNPGVGCILVNKDGVAVSRGSTEVCGQRHAERVAIEALSSEHNPHELTLYCTLEPCSHTGRQPPCVDLIIGTGIKRCVVGVGDPDLRVNGRGFSILRAAGVEVETGVLGFRSGGLAPAVSDALFHGPPVDCGQMGANARWTVGVRQRHAALGVLRGVAHMRALAAPAIRCDTGGCRNSHCRQADTYGAELPASDPQAPGAGPLRSVWPGLSSARYPIGKRCARHSSASTRPSSSFASHCKPLWTRIDGLS
ncbi:bifunctional diaminohydroxyphosphoribosylaminopyrimidine deaminase/5-amino-6-(5-phosphoribosylamino)uracil reductase RibD [Xanthomonas fragariae]|uniref:bifunctional diaminohydroxyphosphoribosylaminopyrimidine deaminase/5-amino-6-(5-phosphoribosylamino)uracil reductase RibD n=1 Tax=Xanthomonas fragariae TaxID=48664 RepID=UPI003FCEE3F4